MVSKSTINNRMNVVRALKKVTRNGTPSVLVHLRECESETELEQEKQGAMEDAVRGKPGRGKNRQ